MRPARGTERLEEMRRAAVAMFHERGYTDTSVEEVAGAVGLLKGSLYHYIDSKEDLLVAIVEEVHGEVQAVMDAWLGRDDLPALERLRSYVREQVDYNARNIEKISVYYHEWQRLTGDRLSEARQARRRQERQVVGLLEQARADGEIAPDTDPKIAARCAFAVMIWPYTWYRSGVVAPEQLAGFCADFVLDGVMGAVGAPA